MISNWELFVNENLVSFKEVSLGKQTTHKTKLHVNPGKEDL